MDPTNKVDENELQKAINSITSGGDGEAGTPIEVATPGAGEIGLEETTAGVPAPEVVSVATADAEVAPAPEAVAPTIGVPEIKPATPSYSEGSSDLGAVKTKALTDLRPLVDKVEMTPEEKFKIYKEIIVSTKDKAAVEPAYETATRLTDEKEKAEALLYIVKTIDEFDA